MANGTFDFNKGATAIMWGLVERLLASGFVRRVTIVPKTAHIGEDGHRLTRSRFGSDVRLLPAPLHSRRYRRRNPLSDLGPLTLATAAALTRPTRAAMARRDEATAALMRADLVFSRGGPFFAVPRGRANLGLRLCWPFLVARRHGTPFAISGEGIGHFDNPMAAALHRWVFENAAYLSVRDQASRLRLLEMGRPDERIRIALDHAFWVRPDASDRLERITESHGLDRGRFLAVTVADVAGARNGYLPELARTVRALVPGTLDRVALVTNVYHPGRPNRGDRGATRSLLELLGGESDRIRLVDEDLTPGELAALYGRSAALHGTRLHSVILALVGGAPVVGVSYLPKTRGALEVAGLEDFVLPLQTYRSGEAGDLVRRAMSEQGFVMPTLDRLRGHADADLGAFLAQVACS